jgi:hypothetical protein
MDNRRRPIGGAAGKAVFGCLAVVIDGHGLLMKAARLSRQLTLITARTPAGVSQMPPT